MITKPGVYDLPAEEYHADPVEGHSLSSTGARKILNTTPAVFRHEQLNPPKSKKAFDLGHAAHSLVLGVGQEIEVCDFPNWMTKASKEAKTAAYAAGKVPLLPPDFEVVTDMAKAIQEHPIAASLFQGEGNAEQAYIWTDPQTGVHCRGLLDWVRPPTEGKRAVLVDYKTTISATPAAIAKSVHDHGYHQQQEWYRAAYMAQHPYDDDEPVFLFVFQEKTAPYLVHVVELDAMAVRIGQRLNRDALDLYKWCADRDEWPGYGDQITLVSLPAWAENRHVLENSP